MTQPRAADDFAMIRARMKELRRERERAEAADSTQQRDAPTQRGGSIRWQPQGTSVGSVRQSGSGTQLDPDRAGLARRE